MVHGPSMRKYADENPDVVLAACCDMNEERAISYKERFGFERHYTDMHEMLACEKPDAVSVIVPERLVADVASDVMSLGYPTQMEKPPGLCREETLKLIAAADKSGVINQVAFNRRHMPMITKLKDEIAQLKEGELQNLRYEFYRFKRREPIFEAAAIHGIDAAKAIIGSDYKTVRLMYQELPHIGEKVCNTYITCTFENGATALLSFCPCTGIVVERVCVNATSHTYILETPVWDGYDAPGKLVHVQDGKVMAEYSGLDMTSSQEMYITNGFYDENKNFFDHVRRGEKCKDDVRSCLQSVEIAECIKNRVEFYEKTEI